MDTTTITVTARKWEGGWDLILDEDNATSVRYLRDATVQVRDYLDTIDPDKNHDNIELALDLDIGSLKEDIARVRRETREAAAAQEFAAQDTRQVVRSIRKKGFTMDDAADMLGVSKGRISQLVSR